MPSNKKVSAPKKKVVKKAPVVEPKVESPVQENSVVEAPQNTVDNYAQEFSHLVEQLKVLQNSLKELTVYTSKLEKRVAKDQKVLQKRVNGKRKRTNTSSSPSGFSKPGPVSDELRAFLKLDKDELISRTQVTKKITAYLQEHNLQKDKDKRSIHPDKALAKLLRYDAKKDEPLTFFNLQRFMKVHYPDSKNGGAIPANA